MGLGKNGATVELLTLVAAAKGLGLGIVAFQEDEHGRVLVAHHPGDSYRTEQTVKGVVRALEDRRAQAIQDTDGGEN